MTGMIFALLRFHQIFEKWQVLSDFMQDIWISKLKKLLSSELSTTYELQIFAATLGFWKVVYECLWL